jgi:formylglycine-generating enzyme required for sulfatase activity
MTTRNSHRTVDVFHKTALPLAGLFPGTLLFLMLGMFSFQPTMTFAEANESVPDGMAYIATSPTVIGIDKDPSNALSGSPDSVSAYQRRMSMPWSKEAFHDEGPAHWVFLDGYFIDKYETSNQLYAEFMKATGHIS